MPKTTTHLQASGTTSYSIRRTLKKILKSLPAIAIVHHKSADACRNLGTQGHNSISHAHAQFPKNYNLEDVLVSHYCYRHYNQSCPTCHTHGLLEYSCSFCIENSCEQETCGNQWGWLNKLEECRQTIVITETYNTNLDRLQELFEALINGIRPSWQNALENRAIATPESESISQLLPPAEKSQPSSRPRDNTGSEILDESDLDSDSIDREELDLLSPSSVSNTLGITTFDRHGFYDGKFPQRSLDYRIYCADPNAELNKATLRCYSQCPPNYNRYGVSCFSNCALPQKDEFSTYCIEPEVRKPIELYSSCAEDCNENNIRDFCFACPEGMHKKDCQCVKSEKIEFREILERSYTNAIMLLVDEG